MMDLVACPVCTLYLHKGMSLAEHLETHPKEQVIRALVSLATGSVFSNDTETINISKTSTSTASTITSSKSVENIQTSNLILHNSSESKTRSSDNDNNSTPTLKISSTNSNASSSFSATSILSPSFGENIGKCQQNTSDLIVKPNSAINQVIEGNNEQSNLYTNNTGNQSSVDFSSNVQLFNAKPKHLSPPPAYGQAISQLRSQNNINFARTNTTKSLANLSLNNGSNTNNINLIKNNYSISSNSSTSYSIVNQQTTNYYTNSNKTLDFSLPKQIQESNGSSSVNDPSSSYTSPSHIRHSQNTEDSLNNQHYSEISTDYLSSNSNNEKCNDHQEKVNNCERTSSPICLITSNRSNESNLNESHQGNKVQSHSSSVLRFADTPPTAQYIERDCGDFLVQESPRHIVEYIEKDNGEFSVIEKVIRSPPSIISINDNTDENIETSNNEDVLSDTEDNIEGTKLDLSKKNNEIMQNNICNDDIATHSENEIKIEHSDNMIENENNTSSSYLIRNKKIEEKSSISKRKLNSKGVKVLSNVKLDANKSLEIVENIQKCSTEQFWTGIVNTIKKEENDKIYNSISIPSTSASNILDEIEEQNVSSDKTTSRLCDLSNILNHESATKIIATSVIRLATNQKQMEIKTNNCKKTKSNKNLIIPKEKDDNEEINSNNKTAVASSSTNISKPILDGKKNPYKRNPKKLVVKFKNPLPPRPSSVSSIREPKPKEIMDMSENESNEIDICSLETSSIYISCGEKDSTQKIIEDTDENTLNNMMEQIVNEEDTSYGDTISERNNINSISVNNVTEKLNLKMEPDSDLIKIVNVPTDDNIPSSTLKLPTTTNSNNLNPLSSSNNDEIQQSASDLIDSEYCHENKNYIAIKSNDSDVQHDSQTFSENRNNESFSSRNITKTVFIIEELDDERQCERKVSSFTPNNQLVNSYNEFTTINCAYSNGSLADATTSESLSVEHQASKQVAPKSERTALVIDLQNNHNNIPSNTYCDYPFSFLYSTQTSVVSNATSINFPQDTTNTQISNNENSNSCSNSNLVDKSTNSVVSASTSSLSICSKNGINDDNASNGNIQIFNRYVPPTIFSSRENVTIEEKNSYIDLDLCTRHIIDGETPIDTSCISNEVMSMHAVSTTSTANSRDNLVTELNIRTDEKMPAKGEISEQESNGDIENSWSQPIYNELTYKYSNPYDASHESWSLSHDDFFYPPDINNIRSKNSRNPDEESDIKPNIPGTSSERVSQPTTSKKVKKCKKPPALFSNSTSVLDTVNLNNALTSAPQGNGQILITNKKKAYHCDHCAMIFIKLKDRNHHMISIHQYKRVNRRLIREAPSSTVTSATINNITDIDQSVNGNATYLGDTKPDVSDSTTSLVISQQYIKTENDAPEILEQVTSTDVNTSRSDEVDDKKPVLSLVAAKHIVSTNLPRTKYDSIRTNVYRLLMNFNLGVLKQSSKVEIDGKLFNSKSFFCLVCKRDFISVKLFDEHLLEHPAECFTCGKKFSRWTYFSIHLKRHLGWKDFGCTICQKKFVIRSALVEHMRIHTGLTPLKCSLCNKSFKRYSNLTQHKRVCHTKKSIRKKDYVCYCGEVSQTKARYIWHKETHDQKPKCCPWCCDRFIHVNSLRRHIRLAHADKFAYNEPAECPICNNIYAKTSLKSHMATHSIDTQHECAICNKSFSTKWNLKIHSWVHANRTAKPFKCEYCTKAFVREIDYKNHMNAHKQIRPYTCEYCGCKFIRKYNYLRHRREHHGLKKFSCDLCGKLFHRHYYLIEHRRIHTGERPFLCTICGKSSTTKTNHNKHLKIHHSRDPFTSEA